MDQVSEIREKTNLVSLIQSYVPLKKIGANFKANCPFHGEKTPSFVVSPERQIWHCFGCFPPGQLIKTPFGYHPIETIDENHWVISGKGNIQKVLNTMEHQYKGSIVEITLRKLKDTVSLTSDHTVFTVRPAVFMQKKYKYFSKRYAKYVALRSVSKDKYENKLKKYLPMREIQAGELQKGDLLLYPISRRESNLQEIDLIPYKSKLSRLGPVPRKTLLTIKINEDFLKLLGYYIAEGSSHRAYIRFSLGNHEEDFAQEIVYLIKKIFGLEAKIYRRPSLKKTGLEISACHSILANIFENLCGKGAQQKHIPFILQELPPEQQKIILESIYRGDGTTFRAHRSKNWHKSIATVSPVLAEQIVDTLLRLHIFPTKSIEKEKTDKHQIHHKQSYSISWSEEAKQKYNAVYYAPDGTEYWLLPIVDIQRKEYEGPVYNFTVNQDHSYVATNFAVANCGKGGDCYSFLMEYEHIEFPEALRMLAEKAGVTLQQKGFDTQTSSKKELIYKLNALAAEFYHYVLTSHPSGKHALAYLATRNVKPQTAKTYMLGFAPPSGTSLVRYLMKKKNYRSEDILDAGLATKRATGIVDFFQNRLIFPLHDHRGNIIGFSGRILTSANTSKYINTRETLVYHKGSVFFGLDSAKDAIKKENKAIIMEGELDVIAAFQQGIRNVVAIKGTALTTDQVQLLARFTTNVALCLDSDTAGQEAMKRSLEVLEKKGFTTTVIVIPNGKDPDEAIKTDPIAFKKAIEHDIPIYDILLEKAVSSNNPTTAQGKKKIGDMLLPFFSHITNEIVKQHYLQTLSHTLNVPLEALEKEIERVAKKEIVGNAVRAMLSQPEQNREDMLEEFLVALLVQYGDPQSLLPSLAKFFQDYEWRTPSLQKVITYLSRYTQQPFSSKAFLVSLPAELLPIFDTCFLLPLDKHLPLQVIHDAVLYGQEVQKVAKELSLLALKRRKIKTFA